MLLSVATGAAICSCSGEVLTETERDATHQRWENRVCGPLAMKNRTQASRGKLTQRDRGEQKLRF